MGAAAFAGLGRAAVAAFAADGRGLGFEVARRVVFAAFAVVFAAFAFFDAFAGFVDFFDAIARFVGFDSAFDGFADRVDAFPFPIVGPFRDFAFFIVLAPLTGRAK